MDAIKILPFSKLVWQLTAIFLQVQLFQGREMLMVKELEAILLCLHPKNSNQNTSLIIVQFFRSDNL